MDFWGMIERLALTLVLSLGRGKTLGRLPPKPVPVEIEVDKTAISPNSPKSTLHVRTPSLLLGGEGQEEGEPKKNSSNLSLCFFL